MITDYHAKYFAHELTKRCSPDSVEKIAGAVASAQVDLNPHQVDAALFAFKSPLSKGALLADEVGLGKTIEAGLVLSQKWAERKRRILVITPSNLRKQWHQELTEKFFLPCRLLESKSYNAAIKKGQYRPFVGPEIVICSYQFAKNKADDVHAVPWDLVVIDEAHRLRNVYKPKNVIANTLKIALAGKDKLLLTATPLQNSLLELFGLVSFIDEHTFGDLKSFREQFANLNQEQVFHTLKARLKPVCHRTLRRQVTAYIPYTKRLPLVEEFTPQESEDRLYELITEYLQRDNLHALPSGQRSLITLVLRKLLASSTFAIAGALTTISNRLKAKLSRREPTESLEDALDQDYEALDVTAEEWADDEYAVILSEDDRNSLEQEIALLDAFTELATSIEHNAKGLALLKALDIAFTKALEIGAAQKAIIFTESRRTQDYLLRLLADSPFAEGIVLFNGSNTDERSRQIYSEWLEWHQGTYRITGSRTGDMRSALVDYFRERGRIMIATEAGAEGINLQFCSLVVNYDLPWNPQRIEQRIGRCHRYGQKYDVVVVNFLNRKNAADQRVFQLLSEKFQLFEGVFGASDEVLGALESGVDFEKRIAAIYQCSRKPEDIQSAFDQLQLELSLEINESMTQTRRKLLEHFDDEVREKLKVCDEDSKAYLNLYERLLIQLTRHELSDHAEFSSDASFRLKTQPFPEHTAAIPLGLYELPRRTGEAHLYRLNHPLAEAVVAQAKERDLPTAEIHFDYEQHEGKVTLLEPFIGKSGWLVTALFTVESLDQAEDHLILAAMTDGGHILDEGIAARLLLLPGSFIGLAPSNTSASQLEVIIQNRQTSIQREISERNAHFFEAEADKLDGWADDLKVGLEREIKEFDRQIKEARRATTIALTLEEKLAGQKQIRTIEMQRNQKRRTLFDAQDQVDRQREELIAQIEGKLQQQTELRQLFYYSMEYQLTVEIPIEMLHLPQSLRSLFLGKVPEANSGTPEEREKNFQSRALAAYAIHKLGSASMEEAVGSIVDGGGDGGIDAIFHAANTHTLWVVQSKFIANGRGEPDLGDVTKFKTGLENLLQGNFAAFQSNAAWRELIPQLEAVFGDGALEVRAVLVYSGINLVSEDRRRLFEDLKRRFSPNSEYIDTRFCNLTTVHDWITGADQGPGVPEVELTLLNPGWVRFPYETVYGLLPLADLANLYARHGHRLIAANIRAYKGNTAVNEQIANTVREEPAHFFYLNNGLTAYCERLEVSNLDRANAEQKRIKGYRLSIINGAQTLGSVAQAITTEPTQAPEGFVFLKIVSLERFEDDREFADRITRSTNFQNQIGLRDFVALDNQQEMIANQLILSGISYHFKSDVEAPSPDETNFNLEEATSACACLAQLADCDFCARVLANRQSLWSMEEIYPYEELHRSRYSRVFRPDRSARTIWRAVQTQRLVVKAMQDNGRASTGIRKAFFENARWLILNVIFLKLHPEQGDALKLTEADVVRVKQSTVEYSEALLEACEAAGFVTRRVNMSSGMEPYEQSRHFRSIFSAAGDCQVLRNALLARLAQAEAATDALAPGNQVT